MKNNILKLYFAKGSVHDFKLFEDSQLIFRKKTKILLDKGYIGINKRFKNIEISKKEDKIINKEKSKRRIAIENLFCHLKKFNILTQKFQSNIKSFISKFTLISGF